MNTHENPRYALARDALESIRYFYKKDYGTVFIGKDLDSNQVAMNSFDEFESEAGVLGAVSGVAPGIKKAANGVTAHEVYDYDVLITDDALILGINDASALSDELVKLSNKTLKGWSAAITADSFAEMEAASVNTAEDVSKTA